MACTLANGQPAAIARYRDSAYGLGVLTVTPTGIARITVFGGGPDLAAKFGFPPDLGGYSHQRPLAEGGVVAAEDFDDGRTDVPGGVAAPVERVLVVGAGRARRRTALVRGRAHAKRAARLR